MNKKSEFSPYSEGQETVDLINSKLMVMQDCINIKDMENQGFDRLVFIGLLTEIKTICEIAIDELLEVS